MFRPITRQDLQKKDSRDEAAHKLASDHDRDKGHSKVDSPDQELYQVADEVEDGVQPFADVQNSFEDVKDYGEAAKCGYDRKTAAGDIVNSTIWR